MCKIPQRSQASISAIDIEEKAALQARENVAGSPWMKSIAVEHLSLQDFEKKCNEKFDLIVSNPPFFSRSLQTQDMARNIARHNSSLPFIELIHSSFTLLNEGGSLAVILPKDESEEFEETAFGAGFFLLRKTGVRPKPGKEINRVLLEFTKKQNPISKNYLSVYAGNGSAYSEEYILLTKDFYLNH